MNEIFNRKYRKVLEILPDVAACAQGKLMLVGGTALALFHLKHRISVDLDFVPVSGSDTKLKEELKGCLSKRGYRTTTGAYSNQFVVQFEDTSIKIEIFEPEWKIKRFEEHTFGTSKLNVASLDDILHMKQEAYLDRNEARDLFDIFCILKEKNSPFTAIKTLISRAGKPKNAEDIAAMALNQSDVAAFQKVIVDATP